MSHKCGSQCRRKQVPSTRRFCSTCGSASARSFPSHITLAGETFRVPDHARIRAVQTGVTGEQVANAWNDWVVRGTCRDERGNYHPTRWGLRDGQGSGALVKVVVERDNDDRRFVSIYRDRTATKNFGKGRLAYFEGRCLDEDYEVRG